MSKDHTCYHSMMVPDCIGCWESYVSRQIAHIDRLRQMVVDAGATQELVEHDAYWFGGNATSPPDPSVLGHVEATDDERGPFEKREGLWYCKRCCRLLRSDRAGVAVGASKPCRAVRVTFR